jgi:hypothetical protein
VRSARSLAHHYALVFVCSFLPELLSAGTGPSSAQCAHACSPARLATRQQSRFTMHEKLGCCRAGGGGAGAGRPKCGRRRARPAEFSARQPAPGERGRFGMPCVMGCCAAAAIALGMVGRVSGCTQASRRESVGSWLEDRFESHQPKHLARRWNICSRRRPLLARHRLSTKTHTRLSGEDVQSISPKN